jgi:hypothetical protein
MSHNSRRFLTEQLQLLIDQLQGTEVITSDFLQAHLASINEHAARVMLTLPSANDSEDVGDRASSLRSRANRPTPLM